MAQDNNSQGNNSRQDDREKTSGSQQGNNR